MLSALFIMAANSWMQHPVGYTMNTSTHQPQLNDIWALFTNPVFLWAYTHVILASLVTGRHRHAGRLRLAPPARKHQVEAFRRTAIISLAVLPRPSPSTCSWERARRGRGHVPADEDRRRRGAVDHLPVHCPFSLFQIGGGNNDETPTQIIEIPDLLSILATNHLDGEVQGLNNLQAQYQKEYGPGNYIPNVFIQYWSMRVMAYLADARRSCSPCGGSGSSAARRWTRPSGSSASRRGW